MSVTRIAWVPLKAGVDEAAIAPLKAAAKAVIGKSGLEAAYNGLALDSPPSLYAISTWSSVDAAKAAEASPAVAELESVVASLLDTSSAQPYTNLVDFNKPFESTIGSAPVTRLLAIFLPASVNQAEFLASWEAMEAAVAGAGIAGYRGLVRGWAHNHIEHPSLPGGPANIFVAAAGWDSLDASLASQSAPGMAEHDAKLTSFGGIFEVHHVSLTKV